MITSATYLDLTNKQAESLANLVGHWFMHHAEMDDTRFQALVDEAKAAA